MEKSRLPFFVIVLVITIGLLFWSMARSEETMHAFLKSPDLKWTEAPPSLPPGSKISLLEGDLSKAEPFTFRMILPPNYRIPPHTHPTTEHVTVLSGTFYMGTGENTDYKNGVALTPGSFAFFKAGESMSAWTKDETVIQVHGVGPWGITYINPKDDPRNIDRG